jgi:hypothetical protein
MNNGLSPNGDPQSHLQLFPVRGIFSQAVPLLFIAYFVPSAGSGFGNANPIVAKWVTFNIRSDHFPIAGGGACLPAGGAV